MKLEISTLILAVLATWRLTSLLSNTNELGPYEVLQKIRHMLGVRWDKNSEPYGKTEVAKGLICFWCCSVWVGVGVAVALTILSLLDWWLIPLAALAFSGGAILFWEWI